MPTVASDIPITEVVRMPSRFTSSCERPAPIPIPTVTGRKARPAWSGEKPSTRCT